MKRHELVEKNIGLMIVLIVVAISFGGLTQIVPLFFQDETTQPVEGLRPYTSLELEGRDIYIREGCVSCHSQMIRPFRSEVERYGEYSKSGEFVYDHPFLWGSKRTGPDLHRIGGKYSDNWHFNHMYDPESTSPGSIMPSYGWLITAELNKSLTERKMRALQKIGVPYTDEEIETAQAMMDQQATKIEQNLYNTDSDLKDAFEADRQDALAKGEEFVEMKNREIVALIAYLQRLGTDINMENTEDASAQN